MTQPQRETPTLEFKRSLSLETIGEKNEAEKDVQGLANAGDEGVLIYGISESELEDGSKVAGELTPVDGGLAEQLNNVIDGRGEPRVPFDLHVIQAEAGRVYIAVVYGHRRPHMARNGRYYLRRNLQVRPMTEVEVEEAYRDRLIRRRAMEALIAEEPAAAPDAAAAALAAVDERVHRGLTPPERALYEEQTGEPTPPGWLSVVAHPVPLQANLINASRIDVGTFYGIEMQDRWREIEPTLAHYHLHPRIEGFFAQLPDRDDTYPRDLLRLWRDGVVEYGTLLEQRFLTADPMQNRVIPSHAVAQYVHDFLLLFARIYRVLGYGGTVRAFARLDDIADYSLALDPARAWIDFASLQEEEIAADPCVG